MQIKREQWTITVDEDERAWLKDYLEKSLCPKNFPQKGKVFIHELVKELAG